MTLRTKLKAAAGRVGVALLRDGPGVAGVLMISVGVGEIYAPAGLIVGGGFLLAGTIVAAIARRGASVADPHP